MSKTHIAYSILALVFLGLIGCSIAGTWRTIKVQPDPPGGYPISRITFDDHAMTFAATTERDNETVISEGQYDWDGFHLTLKPKDKPERNYSGFLWWGKWRLDHTTGGTDYKATLIRDEVESE